MRLSDFDLLSFDCYGTLIDWESGILTALQALVGRSGQSMSDDDILQAFARHEATQEADTPSVLYSEVLTHVHQGLADEWQVETDAASNAKFGASVRLWPAFPDSIDALQYLKRHYKLAILSNVDNDSFASSNIRLGVEFDYIFTAEDIGSYKPDVRNFEYMIERLTEQGIETRRILHTAQSLFHDHVPANQVGLNSAWINRRGKKLGAGATPMPDPMPHFEFEFRSLADMVTAHHHEGLQ